MINSDDLSQMQSDLASVRADNDVSLVFRRGDSNLAAQTVRIARTGGRGAQPDSEGGSEARGNVIVMGATGLDMAIGDRFTHAGILYRVTFIRPNRTVMTVAEAEAVE